jgi:MSHA biogenesis protein MshM
MYQSHFGLQELPFGITPDTSFAYACASHQEALNTLLIAVGNGEGFIKITGEVGTGKTLLCRKFLATLDASYASAYIPNPYLEPRTLLLALAEELGVDLASESDQYHLLKGLNRALLDLAGSGKSVVLCLDEAQAMPVESLEALRLLTNLETGKRKLLQVILFGQPELDDKLALESVRQLRQRITFQYRLGRLDRSELDHYVTHRLRVAGHRGDRIFASSAVRALHAASGGIPRLVNIVAHKAMLLAFGEGVVRVSARHVRAAVGDTPAARRKVGWRLGYATLLASAGGLGWLVLSKGM